MYSINNDTNIDIYRHRGLLVQSTGGGWQIDERAKPGRQNNQNSRPWFLWIVILLISITLVGCDSSSSQNEPSQRIHGIVTQVETGKDGVQVELETEYGFYNVTISVIQAEIERNFEQIKIGAEIEVTGRIINGMETPLMVADEVTVLKNKE
jgi:hypothetical protein